MVRRAVDRKGHECIGGMRLVNMQVLLSIFYRYLFRLSHNHHTKCGNYYIQT